MRRLWSRCLERRSGQNDLRESFRLARERWLALAYTYRWDFLALLTLCLSILLFLAPLWKPGHIVFSDLDFGFDSRRYLNEIYGVWNERWSTSTLLNLARLPWILGPWLLSGLFGWSGPVFLKSFITALLLVSAVSMYWLCKRITSVYFSRHFDFITIFGLVSGALFYALNPWVVFRIQHVFLLCGYSLMPLCILFFFNAFDPRFQRQFIAEYDPAKVGLYRRHIFDLSCFALSFSVCAGAIHYFFYGVIFFSGIGVLLLVNTLRLERGGFRRRWSILKSTLVKLVTLTVLFGCFSAFWLGTYVLSILKHTEVSQNNVNVIDTLSLFSRNSSPLNVVYLISYWWPMFDLHALPLSFWLGGGVLLSFIGFCIAARAWHHRILFLFTLLSLAFGLMGTGVKVESFANIFVLIVTKTPVIGSIFRDPNKAVALMAIGFSILLSFGTQILIRWLAPPQGKRWMQAAVITVVIAALWFYVAPMRRPFIEGFYAPVKIPAEYARVQSEFLDPDRFDSRVLYLPVADAMTQPETGISTPFWNVNPNPAGLLKATGDFQVYSSSKNTLFQHEGSSPNVGYYLDFLQNLLDNGSTRRMASLLTPLGVNELAYRKEYLGQEKRQQFNLDVLSLQPNLTRRVRDGIFTLFKVEKPLPYMSVVPRRIFTPYGLTSLESYGAFPRFNFQDNGVVFSGWEKKGGLDVAQAGDLFDLRSLDDLALTTLDSKDYLRPFDAVSDGDPFLKWSKTLLGNPDWQWSLRSQNLRGFTYETDLNAGVVLTFASRRLDLRPYQMDRAQKQAPVVVDFDQVLRQDKMFVADAPDKVVVQSYPGGPFNRLPLVHGEVSRGEAKNIWQVAKSGYFKAAPDTPYQFRVVASGRGTNRLHIKARFFDADHNEIGAQYVVTPSEKIDFDAVNMFGECISPPRTRWMRLDLLTFPRKGERVYWWIHDVEIRTLAKWAVPNTIHATKKIEKDGRFELFARVLMSPRGGLLRIGFGAQQYNLSTKEENQTQFAWKWLGSQVVAAGERPVTIENLGGFNAVNVLAIVPSQHLQAAREKVYQSTAKGRVFMVMQAETDFQTRGPIQSFRSYPNLAMGQGFACQQGQLFRSIDIVKAASYTAGVWLTTGNGRGHVALTLTDARGRKLRRVWKSEPASERAAWVVEPDPTDEKFPRRLFTLPRLLTGYRRIELPLGHLDAGPYKLSVDINSNVSEMSALSRLRPFSPKEIKVSGSTVAEKDSSCADCVSLTDNMMHNNYDAGTGIFRMECQPTCSCQWYINSTEMLAAEPQSEYLISFQARSQGVRRRHTKVFCLDAQKRPLSTVYIDEIEESLQSRWHRYQQIILTPRGTRFLQFHIWARGGEKGPGTVELRQFSFLPMRKLLLVDQVAVVEGGSTGSLFHSPTPMPALSFGRIDAMRRWFHLDGPAVKSRMVRFSESPSPLWEMRLGGKTSHAAVAINGVSNGFITAQSGEGTVETALGSAYRLSIFLFGFGILLAAVLWRVSWRHSPPED